MPTVEANSKPKPFPFEVGQTVTVYRKPVDRSPAQMEGGWKVIFIPSSKNSVMVEKKSEGGKVVLNEVPAEVLKKWTDGIADGTELYFQDSKYFAMSIRQGRAEMVKMDEPRGNPDLGIRNLRKVLPILEIMEDNEWTAVM